ncbi:hypothetical protein CF15_08260 [Pyrodictium occultum]|uniref:Polysaccharide biosynthesis protein C-terminal domain-containing protein n=1 Tax=Pyrodictium occultum TaxID=2309 RepID=A0A0V8RRM5_PYROC|nr:hypothetical protein CF15_08260 [Pyrodictium occultum]
MSLSRLVRGGLWLYASRLVNALGGFLYWLVVSRLAGPGLLGRASAVVGLAGLVSGAAGLGAGAGLQHRLGRCLGAGDEACLRRVFWSTLYAMALVYLAAGSALALLGLAGRGLGGLGPRMLLLSGALAALGVAGVVEAALLALLRSDLVLASRLLGNLSKLALGAGLVALGAGLPGVVAGYALLPAAVLLVGLPYLARRYGAWIGLDAAAVAGVLAAGLASWAPGVVVLAGQWLGVLLVYGSSGAVETGYYYVAFAAAGLATGLGMSVLSLLLPVLSGMAGGRGGAAWRALRVSLAVTAPVAFYAAAYPGLVLGLLGRGYASASAELAVLLTGFLPDAVNATVSSLAYAHGRYRLVLAQGLAASLPRLLLYLVLVPRLHGLGAAVAYALGSYAGLAYSAAVAGGLGLRLDWRLLGGAAAVPAALAALARILGLHWLAGAALLALSYPAYGRLGVLERRDLRDLARGLLGERAGRLARPLSPLIDALFQ